ncbi:MAG: HAMP domain-containing histidine kinase [Dysgonamonadaceae bacterium]|jgi:signal transduction histidine kinase|nr:HAMP domain-containing histidine kinase [Dysgonamonadaceae bacterium]
MNYKSGKQFKYSFIFTAVIIAMASVWITNVLVNELKEEERKKIEVWAGSVALMSTLSDDTDTEVFNNLLNIIQGNTTIPVILTDNLGVIRDNKNIHLPEQHVEEFLKKKIERFAKTHDPIIIRIDENFVNYVYYEDSSVLKQLQWFPFIQLAVVFIFILISFLALNSTKKAEQNKVWVGLSKETAHQLGTPISSLMAWVEYLKTKNADIHLLNELDKDVQRLRIIAERFSKIGSNPTPKSTEIKEALAYAVGYMENRISAKVSINITTPDEPIHVLLNDSLFGWTMENLIKNAVDAMDGQGRITINAFPKGRKLIIDVSDTGKGIPKSNFETVFQPGYTTKTRGWGLGLSLVKRIIESYLKGKIYVHKSEAGKGTTFRLELNQCLP